MSWWQRCMEIGWHHIGRDQTKIRFLFAGAFNTVLGVGLYPALYILMSPLKLHYLFLLAINLLTCMIFSFLTNKFFVFRTSGNYLPEIGKFITFHFSYILINFMALPVLVEFAGMNPVLAQTLFAVVVVVGSYFWHSRITFFSRTKQVK